MKKEAYNQYVREVDNWLHNGRRLLLETCLGLVYPSSATKRRTLRILEIGAGSGKNVKVLSKFGVVDAVEIEPIAIKLLRECLHLQQLFTFSVPFPIDQKYDVICAMDFLEHTQNDKQVFQWMVDNLNSGGVLFLTVPAYQFLFCYHDVALGHFRRYRLKQLVKLNNDRLLLLKKGYFNSLLFPLAAVSRFLGHMTPIRNKGQMKQSGMLPLLLDKFFFGILKAEANLIRRHQLFPYGLTAFALFRKFESDAAPDLPAKHHSCS